MATLTHYFVYATFLKLVQQLILQISWHVELKFEEYSRKKKDFWRFERKLRILENPWSFLDLIVIQLAGKHACLINKQETSQILLFSYAKRDLTKDSV